MLSFTTSLSDSFSEYNQIKEQYKKQKITNESCYQPIKNKDKNYLRNVLKEVTVEPVTFCYACALILHAPLIQQYVYQRLSEERGLPSSVNNDLSSCDFSDTPIIDKDLLGIRKEVQSLTSYVYLGIILSASMPSLFMALLLGSWSDQVGRKIVILLPVIGGFLDTTCILITMFSQAPLYLLFVGSFLNGVCGFFTTMILAVFAYMADITTERNRALRLGILEAVAFVSGMISHLSSGWWIRHLGFKAPYMFIISLHSFSLLYIWFILPESLSTPAPVHIKNLFDRKHLLKVHMVFKSAHPNKKWQLYGLLLTSAFLMITSIGFGSVIVLYSLDSPFCFSPILIGYFLAECMFMQAVGAIFALTILTRLLSEIMLTQLGITSIISSLVTIAFITKKWQMFIVPVVGCFGGVCMPVIRAKMSKLVEMNEQGALFSAVATLETLCTLCGAGIFNSLYPLTERNFRFKGFCFLVMAVLLLVPAVVLCLIGVYSRSDDQALKNKESG